MNPLWDMVTWGVPFSIQRTPEALPVMGPDSPKPGGGEAGGELGLELAISESTVRGAVFTVPLAGTDNQAGPAARARGVEVRESAESHGPTTQSGGARGLLAKGRGVER